MEYNAPKSSSKILTGTICFRYNHNMCVKMRLNKKIFFRAPQQSQISDCLLYVSNTEICYERKKL